MKVITCASYYASGSSAVTDFISEFDGVKSLTNYEFRFAHDPDGLSELEFNLVENFNRHNSGHALKRYKKLVDYYGNHLFIRRYEPFFQNKWKELSYKYIDCLSDFTYHSVWQYDYYDRGPWFEFWAKLPTRILRKTIWRNKPEKQLLVLKNEMAYASRPTEEKFLECTRKYTDALIAAANPEYSPIVMMDQLLPSSNIYRHLRYFNNVYIILVDRDPRDIFLWAKYMANDNIVPHDIDLYCKWFDYTRSSQHDELNNPERVKLIQFEDMIYKYENTTEKICKWCGLTKSAHVSPKMYFNPEVSIKNTRIWIQHPEYQKEADEIAKRLPKYLYEA